MVLLVKFVIDKKINISNRVNVFEVFDHVYDLFNNTDAFIHLFNNKYALNHLRDFDTDAFNQVHN